jgi:hypothetical protein
MRKDLTMQSTQNAFFAVAVALATTLVGTQTDPLQAQRVLSFPYDVTVTRSQPAELSFSTPQNDLHSAVISFTGLIDNPSDQIVTLHSTFGYTDDDGHRGAVGGVHPIPPFTSDVFIGLSLSGFAFCPSSITLDYEIPQSTQTLHIDGEVTYICNVPEPSSLALLALGAVAVAAIRPRT